MAATEESASERWWKALATSVGAAVRVPTAWVMRKSHSFLVGVGCGAGVRRRDLPLRARRNRGGGEGAAGKCALPHAHAPRSVARYWCRLVPLADAARLTDERLHASKWAGGAKGVIGGAAHEITESMATSSAAP